MARVHPASQLQPLDSNTSLLGSSPSFAVTGHVNGSTRLPCVWGKLWCSEFNSVLSILFIQLCLFLLDPLDPERGRFSANEARSD